MNLSRSAAPNAFQAAAKFWSGYQYPLAFRSSAVVVAALVVRDVPSAALRALLSTFGAGPVILNGCRIETDPLGLLATFLCLFGGNDGRAGNLLNHTRWKIRSKQASKAQIALRKKFSFYGLSRRINCGLAWSHFIIESNFPIRRVKHSFRCHSGEPEL